MLAQEETDINKDIIRNKAKTDSMKLYEQVRFAPIHGPTPIAPELEAKPGIGGLLLNIGSAAFGTFGPGGTASQVTAPKVGVGGAGQAAANATASSSASLTASAGTSFAQITQAGVTPELFGTARMQQLAADPTFQKSFH